MGGSSTPSVSDVNLWTMDTLRHPAQVWPGFDKKLNFLPSANKAKAAQVQLLFVCDFWQWSSFRNRAGEAKTQWKQCTESFTSSADQRDSWGLLLQTKKLLRKLEANICKSHYFQFKIVFPVFLCFHPKERETWGGQDCSQREDELCSSRDMSAINLLLCHLGQGRRGRITWQVY